MSFVQRLKEYSRNRRTLLCVGLDPDRNRIPEHLKKEKSFLSRFCCEIVEAAAPYCIAFKPNIAFFESFGHEGIRQFEETLNFIKKNYPDHLIVADAKRGDLGNTAKEYAEYFFETLKTDSLTVSPYMGKDSLEPFLKFKDAHLFALCLTSNPGSADLQRLKTEGTPLYKKTAEMISDLEKNYPEQLGLVTGGTHPEEIGEIHSEFSHLPLLIPGFGEQGGSLEEILPNAGRLALINSSRSIIFAGKDNDFASKAAEKAEEIHRKFKVFFEPK